MTYEVYKDGSSKLDVPSRELKLAFSNYTPDTRGLLVLFKFNKKNKILHSLSHVVSSSCAVC